MRRGRVSESKVRRVGDGEKKRGGGALLPNSSPSVGARLNLCV